LGTPNGEKVPLERGIEEHIRHYTEQHLQALFQEHFECVYVERRFHFMYVLNLQFRGYDKWEARNPISKLVLWLVLRQGIGWIYDLTYLLERVLGLERYYNILLDRARTKESRKRLITSLIVSKMYSKSFASILGPTQSSVS
jgi:hypothetical protein